MTGNRKRRLGMWVAVMLALVHPRELLLAQTSSLSLSSAAGSSGGTVVLNLSLAGSATPADLEWTLAYPASQISAIAAFTGPVAVAAGKTISCASAPGVINCLLTGVNTNTITPGVAATLQLTLAANAATTAISVVNPQGVSATGTALAVSARAIGIVTVSTLVSGRGLQSDQSRAERVSTCTVTLTQTAPTGGSSVTLASNNAFAHRTGVGYRGVREPPRQRSARRRRLRSRAIRARLVTATLGSSSQTAMISLLAPVLVSPWPAVRRVWGRARSARAR